MAYSDILTENDELQTFKFIYEKNMWNAAHVCKDFNKEKLG